VSFNPVKQVAIYQKRRKSPKKSPKKKKRKKVKKITGKNFKKLYQNSKSTKIEKESLDRLFEDYFKKSNDD